MTLSFNDSLLLAFYGDDFTGSTDALERLARAGVKTVLFNHVPAARELAQYPGLQAFGVAGATRGLAPEAMEGVLRPAFSALKASGARHIHYKVCSTFDSSPELGSIGRAIDVGAEVFNSKYVPLLVAAPELGRFCVFGNLFARMGIGSADEIYRLDRHPSMSKHPKTPMHESDLREHLGNQTTKHIALFDILNVEQEQIEARSKLDEILNSHPGIVLFDALSPEHLLRVGELIDADAEREGAFFSVGSSGIESALTQKWIDDGALTPTRSWAEPGVAEPLLVVAGSCSPVTQRQITYAVAQGFVEIVLDGELLCRQQAQRSEDVGHGIEPWRAPVVQAAAAAAIAALRAGRSVIVHTGGGAQRQVFPPEVDTARLFGYTLGLLAYDVLLQTPVTRVVIAGGDTSSHAAAGLGIAAVEMIAPLTPGAPLCRAKTAPGPVDGLQVVFKGGQVGSENYFSKMLEGKI